MKSHRHGRRVEAIRVGSNGAHRHDGGTVEGDGSGVRSRCFGGLRVRAVRDIAHAVSGGRAPEVGLRVGGIGEGRAVAGIVEQRRRIENHLSRAGWRARIGSAVRSISGRRSGRSIGLTIVLTSPTRRLPTTAAHPRIARVRTCAVVARTAREHQCTCAQQLDPATTHTETHEDLQRLSVPDCRCSARISVSSRSVDVGPMPRRPKADPRRPQETHAETEAGNRSLKSSPVGA